MGARILVADDDAGIAGLLGDYLAEQGHEVLLVNNGYDLSQKAVTHQPHLIISDIIMPWADGSSVYAVLQKDPGTKNIPVIFMSGMTPQKLKEVLPIGEKVRFVAKPVDFDLLDKNVAELLPLGGYEG